MDLLGIEVIVDDDYSPCKDDLNWVVHQDQTELDEVDKGVGRLAAFDGASLVL